MQGQHNNNNWREKEGNKSATGSNGDKNNSKELTTGDKLLVVVVDIQ